MALLETADRAPRALRLIQVGDIHYPDWPAIQPRIDDKDPALSKPLAAAVGRSLNNPLQVILRRLAHLIHATDVSAVAVVGDITTKGDRDAYENALKHLSPILNMNAYIGRQPNSWLVPGNHDIRRKDAIDLGVNGKFTPLNAMATRYRWPSFPVDNIAATQIRNSHGSINLIQLNSCLGCGDKRYIPEPIRSAVSGALDALFTELASSGATSDRREQLNAQLSEYYESIDTPAFSDAAIQNLIQFLGQQDDDSINVILTHHNLLPQGQPRISVYSELVNGGYLRRALLGVGKTILYLHGHIHEDPIEAVTTRSASGAKIICIAAPELSVGFNEIIVVFDDNATPLGLRVRQHRFDRANGLQIQKKEDIALSTKFSDVSASAFRVLQKVKALGKCHYQQLMRELRDQRDDVAALVVDLQQLYFMGLIRVDRPDHQVHRWTITV